MVSWTNTLAQMKFQVARCLHRWSGKPPLHLLHIGKTGGTAVKHALRQTGCSRYSLQLHGHTVKLWHIPRGEAVFFFVRDPVRRFASGFASRQRQGQPRYHVPWTPAEATAFQAFSSAKALAEALSVPDDAVRAAAEQAMRSIRHVSESFWDWFRDEDYLQERAADVFFVGHQETLDADFVRLRGQLGLPASVVLPNDERQAHKSPAQPGNVLSPLAVANLQAWYRRDYEFLAFCARHFESHRAAS